MSFVHRKVKAKWYIIVVDVYGCQPGIREDEIAEALLIYVRRDETN